MLEVAVALASFSQGLERVLLCQHILHGAARNLLSHELLLVVFEARRQTMRQLFQIGLSEERGGPAKLARRYCASRQLLLLVANLLGTTGYLLVPIDELAFSLPHGLERESIVEAQVNLGLRVDELVEREIPSVLTRLAFLAVPHARRGPIQIYIVIVARCIFKNLADVVNVLAAHLLVQKVVIVLQPG